MQLSLRRRTSLLNKNGLITSAKNTIPNDLMKPWERKLGHLDENGQWQGCSGFNNSAFTHHEANHLQWNSPLNYDIVLH